MNLNKSCRPTRAEYNKLYKKGEGTVLLSIITILSLGVTWTDISATDAPYGIAIESAVEKQPVDNTRWMSYQRKEWDVSTVVVYRLWRGDRLLYFDIRSFIIRQ